MSERSKQNIEQKRETGIPTANMRINIGQADAFNKMKPHKKIDQRGQCDCDCDCGECR